MIKFSQTICCFVLSHILGHDIGTDSAGSECASHNFLDDISNDSSKQISCPSGDPKCPVVTIINEGNLHTKQNVLLCL
jgi:hypothetical protein